MYLCGHMCGSVCECHVYAVPLEPEGALDLLALDQVAVSCLIGAGN